MVRIQTLLANAYLKFQTINLCKHEYTKTLERPFVSHYEEGEKMRV